jgi:hypothetical protein
LKYAGTGILIAVAFLIIVLLAVATVVLTLAVSWLNPVVAALFAGAVLILLSIPLEFWVSLYLRRHKNLVVRE